MGEARSLPRDMDRKLICEVCEKNEAVGVCCVPGVPMSSAYCRECLQANAHPWNVIVANTACVGSFDDCIPEWKEMVRDTCKHLGKTMEEFKAAVAKDLQLFQHAGETMRVAEEGERNDADRLDRLEDMLADTTYISPLHFVSGKSGLIYGGIGGIVNRDDGYPTLRAAIDALINDWENS